MCGRRLGGQVERRETGWVEGLTEDDGHDFGHDGSFWCDDSRKLD